MKRITIFLFLSILAGCIPNKGSSRPTASVQLMTQGGLVGTIHQPPFLSLKNHDGPSATSIKQPNSWPLYLTSFACIGLSIALIRLLHKQKNDQELEKAQKEIEQLKQRLEEQQKELDQQKKVSTIIENCTKKTELTFQNDELQSLLTLYDHSLKNFKKKYEKYYNKKKEGLYTLISLLNLNNDIMKDIRKKLTENTVNV